MTRNATSDDWYVEKRRHIEAFFEDSNLLPDSDKVHLSPSGKHRLVVRRYKTKGGRWHYSRGLLFRGDQQIADVKEITPPFSLAGLRIIPTGMTTCCVARTIRVKQ